MIRRRTGRIVFIVGFAILLLDGAAAIWLGQIAGRPVLEAVGVVLLAAAAGMVVAYRRWMIALDAVDAARRELKEEVGRLRQAADEARAIRRRR